MKLIEYRGEVLSGYVPDLFGYVQGTKAAKKKTISIATDTTQKWVVFLYSRKGGG